RGSRRSRSRGCAGTTTTTILRLLLPQLQLHQHLALAAAHIARVVQLHLQVQRPQRARVAAPLVEVRRARDPRLRSGAELERPRVRAQRARTERVAALVEAVALFDEVEVLGWLEVAEVVEEEGGVGWGRGR